MKIHGLALGVPALERVADGGSRSAKLWASLAEVGSLISLSAAPMPEPFNTAFRLLAWLRHQPSNRFGLTNLRPDVFDLRSHQALLKARPHLAIHPEAILLQEGFFFSPERLGHPYALYVDGTAAMVDRSYPVQVPWHYNHAMRKEWMSRELSLYRSAVHIFTYSEFCRRSILADYGQAASKVTVAYPGANFDLTAQTGVMRAPLRVLFVGYDFCRKGGLVLLDAWQDVRRRCPYAELVIAGPRSLPVTLPDGVRLVGPTIGHRAMRELYESASIFCMPSLFEAFGHVFIEAMSAGLPCVGCDAFAMPEIISPGRDGLLVRPGCASSLAEALVHLLTSPGELRRMSVAAREKASSWPAWSDTARLMIQTLESRIPT